MNKFNIIKASKMLPKGSVNEMSFRLRIPQSTISKILNGKQLKDEYRVREEVKLRLESLRKEIDVLLS